MNVTLTIAIIGAVGTVVGIILGTITLWKNHNKDKVQLKIKPKIFKHLPNGGAISSPHIPTDKTDIWDGLVIEVVNKGFVNCTIESIGLKLTERDKVVIFPGELAGGGKLPKKLEPRESLNYFIHSSQPQTFLQEGLPDGKHFYVTTSCGITVTGNTKVTKWLFKIGRQMKTAAQIYNKVAQNKQAAVIDEKELERRKEADKLVFTRLENLMSETNLKKIINHTRAFNETQPSTLNSLIQLITAFDETQNLYLTQSIQDKRKVFRDSLIGYIHYVREKFGNNMNGLPVGLDRLKYVLMPEYQNVDRRSPQFQPYLDASAKLSQICGIVLTAYDDYRKEVKSILYI